MNKTKTIILGGGYVASAFAVQGYSIVPREKFYFDGNNFSSVIDHIKDCDVVVNAIAKTDTRWSENSNNFRELWMTNVEFVKLLSDYCSSTGKKLVHLSTIDLYGNCHDYQTNIECKRLLDLNTDYRISKYASERVCQPNDLILRIRLPYDDQLHPKNLLVKIVKFNKFFHLSTGLTYLPDLVNITNILVDKNESGIFNVESTTTSSILYIAKNLLGLPKAASLSTTDENVIIDFDTHIVHPVSNTDKIEQHYKMTDLDSSIIHCFNNLLTKGLQVI